MEKKWTFLQASLPSLPGEKWKDIKGFEGSYKISNFGRVKSLGREIFGRHGVTRVTQDKIMKPWIGKVWKKTQARYGYAVGITLHADGTSHTFQVARLVYNAFVDPIDVHDTTLQIAFVDGESRNLHASNLRKVSRNSLVERVPVTQFDSTGRPVATYLSIYDAARKTGYSTRVIAYAVEGRRMHIYKGYFWRSGKHTQLLPVDSIQLNVPHDAIHESLRRKLRIKRTSENFPPPFLNLSLQNIPGERWRDIPGFEGLYQVSSFGRVKSLQKVSEGKVKKWKPAQIQRLIIIFRSDRHGKRIPARTLVTMSKNGVKKLYTVQRFVYYAFVKKFDIGDPTQQIFFNDANPLNLHYKNLFYQKIARSK